MSLLLALLYLNMPIYEYECRSCGHRFEKWQNMDDLPITKCPVCKGKVKRLISANVGFIFKGPGFYATDYKNKKEEKVTPEKKNSKKEQTKTED